MTAKTGMINLLWIILCAKFLHFYFHSGVEEH